MKAFLATVLLMAAPAAFAQTYPVAPPLAQAQADIFSWQETPRNQEIPIVRAVFDSSGYLLYDENGQMISVPFVGNLYAMQFGKTSGSMYFVNDGGVPTLYIPENGYLENAAVSGARWYPFPQRYYYSRPVYLGPAPSWDAYYNMGWYPGMTVYGGYWGYRPWSVGVVYSPMSCLTISIGSRICRDWNDFCLFGRNYNTVRPIIIRDTRPIYIDQRDRLDRSRGNDRNWDRDRPTYREPSRPGFSAPARHSEERAQGQGSADRFNYGNRNTTPSRSNGEGYSREREQQRPNSPTYSVPGLRNGNGAADPIRGNGSSFPGRERDMGRAGTNPGYTPPTGGAPSGGSREREFNRPSNSPSGGYSVPNMTPVRPGNNSGPGNGGSYPSRENRGGSYENRGGSYGQGSNSNMGRPSDRPTGRTYDAPRESRGSSSPSRESQPSRESSSRERERGKR